MTTVICAATILLCFTVGSHLISVAIAVVRCRARTALEPAPANAPAISLVRPVCGLDNFAESTLRSGFDLDYPDYELIFCVAHARDPIVPTVQKLIAEHPQVRARLLIGDERISANPKLNNCFKGWNAAMHDWIVLADSNVLMPADYLTRLWNAWRHDNTGLVCSPPSGSEPHGFWAGVECAFLNTYEARWQYGADTLGLGFAQGKTMFWRRSVLEEAGGIRLLGLEPAEDAASTKVVRDSGLRVRLVDAPFPQPLGHRSPFEVWHRQARWAQLRRASFPMFYAPEILSGAFIPFATTAVLALALNLSWIAAVLTVATVWYGAEAKLARAAGWPLTWAYPFYALVRDLALPALWVTGWLGSDFVWRGNAVSSVSAGEEPASETPPI
jgi:ceramide glucosyltransferase